MAGMSKRHFEGLADVIDTARAAQLTTPKDAVHAIALELAIFCARENPQFDRARFLKACGFGGEGFGAAEVTE
jgi:hypothetical protein